MLTRFWPGKCSRRYPFRLIHRLTFKQTPYAEFKFHGLPTLIMGICRGDRPTIPSHIPPTYRSLLEHGWHPDPNMRPSFDRMLKDKVCRVLCSSLPPQIFEKILTEAISGGEQLVAQLLKKLNLPSGTDNLSHP